MYKYGDFIGALDAFCRDVGETLEDREERLGSPTAPIRRTLQEPSGVVINRNIRLVLAELHIDIDEFRSYLEAAS